MGGQNMGREMIRELIEPSNNRPNSLSKESEIIDDGKFKKVEDTISVNKGSPVVIIEDNIPNETGNSFKGTRVVNEGPKLVDVEGGALEEWGSQPISTNDMMAQWAVKDFMDIPISSLAQPRSLPKLGEIGVDEESVLKQEPTAMKKWRRKEKGLSSFVQTKSQKDPNGKRKYRERKEALGSGLDVSAKKKAKVRPDLSALNLVEMEDVAVGTGLQSHQSS
ncbi:unnamed protein product [Ilex paraguariensis]|uniref:Uncharacterized protein n=1 Tax=Ilex paraguariensis TaxID=185542 RepID=A0ABC8T2E8_9AQUA